MTLRLGLLGLSDGNGHPYSWAAIINGYEPAAMRTCPFPVIPQYLARETWPDAIVPGARVTHIWTQDQATSRDIAECTFIRTVVNSPADMLGSVDAILLARDDAENHLRFAEPVLSRGLPIYIDKPIAVDEPSLAKLYALERFPGQIFTCSALRYSREMRLSEPDRESLGELREIQAITPKSWDKYAVHIIEPVLRMLPPELEVAAIERVPARAGGGALSVELTGGLLVRLFATGAGVAAPIAVRVHGESCWKDLFFTDTFSAFKEALIDFIEGVIHRDVRSPRAFNERVVQLISGGRSA